MRHRYVPLHQNGSSSFVPHSRDDHVWPFSQAWKEGNHTAADYMSRKIVGKYVACRLFTPLSITCAFISDDAPHLSMLPPHAVSVSTWVMCVFISYSLLNFVWKQRVLLAYKFHQIGRSFLTQSNEEGSTPSDAIQWLQRAFLIADQLEDTTAPGVPELKVCPLSF